MAAGPTGAASGTRAAGGNASQAAHEPLFARITEHMIRRRAEHNEGMVSTLEEVALHQQNLGKIEMLGQLCPKLKILYLQNNLISKLQNLHKLKHLEYLNMAVNNVTRIENLQRCESLTKLDLTINFVDKAGLLTVDSLQPLLNLREVTLMGNPCAEWSGYRPFVVAKLPQLKRLDGQDIKPSERITAQQMLPELTAELRADLVRQGIDPDVAALAEDDSMFDENGQVRETGRLDEETGEMRRPWCAATRILDHMENEKANREAEEKKRSGASNRALTDEPKKPERYEDFPPLKDGEQVMQRNQGGWDFSVEESDDHKHVVLEVDVGRFLDTSLIKADVQPEHIRLLIKGKLLQLLLPCEVRPDAARAQRSQATGRLVLELPKAQADAQLNIALVRPKQRKDMPSADIHPVASTTAAPGQLHGSSAAPARRGGGGDFGGIKEVRRAGVTACEMDDGDDDYVPDL